MHLITDQLNHYQLSKFFYLFASTYRKLSSIFKEPARSTLVSFDRRDRRTLVKFPRSIKTTGRATKGQAAQPTYASLAYEVVPWTCPYIYSPENV